MDELEKIEQYTADPQPLADELNAAAPAAPEPAFAAPEELIQSEPESVSEEAIMPEPEAAPEEAVSAPEALPDQIPAAVPEAEPEEQTLQPEAGNVTFGQSIAREGAVQYAVPVSQARPTKKAARRKKNRRIIGPVVTVLLCLLSALLGGLLGGKIVKRSIPDQPAEIQADPALESRIAALEEAAQKAPQQQAYDAQTPVTTTQVY